MQATSRLVHDKTGVRLQFSHDLSILWNWFLMKETGMVCKIPLRSSKIGLYRANSYHRHQPDMSALKGLTGRKYEVNFDLTKQKCVYSRKGFWIYFIEILDKVVWDLLKELKLDRNFNRIHQTPHMTISNGKYYKDLKKVKSEKWLWNNQFTTI